MVQLVNTKDVKYYSSDYDSKKENDIRYDTLCNLKDLLVKDVNLLKKVNKKLSNLIEKNVDLEEK